MLRLLGCVVSCGVAIVILMLRVQPGCLACDLVWPRLPGHPLHTFTEVDDQSSAEGHQTAGLGAWVA